MGKYVSRASVFHHHLPMLALALCALAVALLLVRNEELRGTNRTLSTGNTIRNTTTADDGLATVSCSSAHECLYGFAGDYYPTGLATVTGHYTTFTTTDFDAKARTCDAFAVREGSEDALAGWYRLRGTGSGVLPTDANNNLLLPLDFLSSLNDISADDVARIKRSALSGDMTLHVFVTKPADVGVDACFSPVGILKAL